MLIKPYQKCPNTLTMLPKLQNFPKYGHTTSMRNKGGAGRCRIALGGEIRLYSSMGGSLGSVVMRGDSCPKIVGSYPGTV